MGVLSGFLGGGSGSRGTGPFSSTGFQATPVGRLSGSQLSPATRGRLKAQNERINFLMSGGKDIFGNTRFSQPDPGSTALRASEFTSEFQAQDIARAAQNKTLLGQIFDTGQDVLQPQRARRVPTYLS